MGAARRTVTNTTISKVELHSSKIIWWNWKDVVFYELLPKNIMISSDIGQLDKLNAATLVKRPKLVNRKGIIFHHDNTKLYTPNSAKMTKTGLKCLIASSIFTLFIFLF